MSFFRASSHLSSPAASQPSPPPPPPPHALPPLSASASRDAAATAATRRSPLSRISIFLYSFHVSSRRRKHLRTHTQHHARLLWQPRRVRRLPRTAPARRGEGAAHVTRHTSHVTLHNPHPTPTTPSPPQFFDFTAGDDSLSLHLDGVGAIPPSPPSHPSPFVHVEHMHTVVCASAPWCLMLPRARVF